MSSDRLSNHGLEDTLGQLETVARHLEPGPNARRAMTSEVNTFLEKYLEKNDGDGPGGCFPCFTEFSESGGQKTGGPTEAERKMILSPSLEMEADGKPGEEPRELGELLGLFDRSVLGEGMNPTSPRFMAYVPGGALYPSALGDLLAATTNRYAGFKLACPGAVKMETLLVHWVAEMMGYDTTKCTGILSSGASVATLSAFTTARDAHAVLVGGVAHAEDPTKNPYVPPHQFVVYCTDQVHGCITKGLHLCGVGHLPLRTVRRDEEWRMDVAHLEELIRADVAAGLHPFLVVGSAGTVNSGTVDPLTQIGAIAKKYGLWYHIDGAYGALLKLSDAGREVLQGTELSDSIVTDPHKTLFLPYGTGMLLVRDGKRLYDTHRFRGAYVSRFIQEDEGEYSSVDLGPEMTKHFRGVRLWLPLNLFGIKPFRAAQQEKILLTRYFFHALSAVTVAPNDDRKLWLMGPFPDLSIATYRINPALLNAGGADDESRKSWSNRVTADMLNDLLRDGRVYLSSTTIDGTFWMRMVIVVFRTHRCHVDEAIELLNKYARKQLSLVPPSN